VPLELVSLVAEIRGESPQRFVLAAGYDTRRFEQFPFVGANDGASGPALLLELARVIQAHPLPYTTWIVFLDGEAPVGAGAEAPPPTGSQALAQELLAQGAAAPVRLVVTFQQVGDAELRVARDLRSHRLFREEFWLAAARLGRNEAFRTDDAFESPPGSHLAFIAAGFRGVVQVTDSSYGGEVPPGAWANSEDDTPERCSPRSLEAVGAVTLEALDRIAGRLAKIDRFTRPGAAAGVPQAPAEPEAAEPPSAGAPPAPVAPEAAPPPLAPDAAPAPEPPPPAP
jgi:Zn-dependent M28 family amino/carboxypeptidase